MTPSRYLLGMMSIDDVVWKMSNYTPKISGSPLFN